MLVKLKRPIKNYLTGEIVHQVGDIIEIVDSDGWCRTYPLKHKCGKCPLSVAFRLDRLQDELEKVD